MEVAAAAVQVTNEGFVARPHHDKQRRRGCWTEKWVTDEGLV